MHALDEQIADVLGEGEFFGFVSIFTGLEAAFTMPRDRGHDALPDRSKGRDRVMATRRGLAFLAGSLRRREVSVLEGPNARRSM